MGKKIKKKARSDLKEKRVLSTSPKTDAQEGTSDAETHDNGVSDIKDRGLCPHIDSGINLDKFSAKLGSSESIKCEDCRENVVDRRARKGKGKHGKRGGINSKSDSKAIWICLECGYFSCGGVGLPTTPQSHAVRHAKQNRHPLAVHYKTHQLVWCFRCDKLIRAEKSEDSKNKEVLNEVVKMLKRQSGERSTVDVEDVWFGSGSVTSEIKSSIGADGRVGYSIRGLDNLGNTCFFNSIMQNLFAINSLRRYFFELDESVSPLTASLRKLFLETSPEAGLKSVINPKSLFGSLCSKAPQFRGYQQHDAHELLRCLLDGLSSEELSTRKHTKSSITDPTFVDAIFGGQYSSTVSCLECGHSSTTYEPFLDLSLPVPTKKPSSRKIKPVIRGKKSKLPPKKAGRNLSKMRREANSLPREGVSDLSTGDNSLAQPADKFLLSSGDSALSDSMNQNNIALDTGLTSDDLSAIQNPKSQQAVETAGEQSISSDSFTWLDYLEPEPVSYDIDVTLKNDEISEVQGFSSVDACQNDVSSSSLSFMSERRIGSNLVNFISASAALDPAPLAQEQNAFPLSADEKNVKHQFDKRPSPEGSLSEEVVQCDSNTSGRGNENPSQIHDSKFMPLPNKEDASSSVEVLRAEAEVSSAGLGDEHDSLDFDGFGDLFNEPEVSVALKPSSHLASAASDTTKTGVIGDSSESDPNEVDDADIPVSIESCLAFFMKPELLSKDEHAWQCENCSKVLQEQRTRQRTLQMSKLEIFPNGCKDRNPSGLLDVKKTCDKVKSMNEDLEEVVGIPSDGMSLSQNKEVYENGKCMLGKNSENTEPQNINECRGPSECSSFSNNTCCGGCDSDKDRFAEIDLLSAKCEPEVSEQEEVNSENLKVKRDATKSILISKAPKILTIQLKRFSQDARGRLSKLNGHVNFRETIDLKPYMDPRCTVREMSMYRLVGVVEHMGSMRSGHYVANVRCSKDSGDDCVWYHASDSYVRQVSLEEVLSCQVYILFYEAI